VIATPAPLPGIATAAEATLTTGTLGPDCAFGGIVIAIPATPDATGVGKTEGI
jgi:hypothetical protein